MKLSEKQVEQRLTLLQVLAVRGLESGVHHAARLGSIGVAAGSEMPVLAWGIMTSKEARLALPFAMAALAVLNYGSLEHWGQAAAVYLPGVDLGQILSHINLNFTGNPFHSPDAYVASSGTLPAVAMPSVPWDQPHLGPVNHHVEASVLPHVGFSEANVTPDLSAGSIDIRGGGGLRMHTDGFIANVQIERDIPERLLEQVKQGYPMGPQAHELAKELPGGDTPENYRRVLKGIYGAYQDNFLDTSLRIARDSIGGETHRQHAQAALDAAARMIIDPAQTTTQLLETAVRYSSPA